MSDTQDMDQTMDQAARGNRLHRDTRKVGSDKRRRDRRMVPPEGLSPVWLPLLYQRGGAHETRSAQSIGAHLPGYDQRSVAVAILGWDGQSPLTDDQLREVAEDTIDHVASLYPDAEIIPATAGFTARADYTELETFVSTINERRRRREGSVSTSH